MKGRTLADTPSIPDSALFAADSPVHLHERISASPAGQKIRHGMCVPSCLYGSVLRISLIIFPVISLEQSSLYSFRSWRDGSSSILAATAI